jgi:hypothetical protein
VTVAAPTAGMLAANVRVVDTGMKVEKQPYAESVAVVVPTRQNPQKSFEKRLTPTAGFVFKDVTVGNNTGRGVVTNVRVQVDKGGGSARILGDWTASPGGEIFVAVTGTQERQVAMNPKETRATDTIATGRASVKIPKRPGWMGEGPRQIYVELTEMQAAGSRSVLAPEALPAAGLVRQVQVAGRPVVVKMQVVNDAVEFVVQ